MVDEAREMDDAVDVVVAGHTHSRLQPSRWDGKLVVEALAYGVAFDRVRIGVDRASGDVVSKSALVVPTNHAGVEPDPRARHAGPELPRPALRWPTAWWATSQRRLDKAAVDRLAVDAQRAFAGADIAFLNPGNTRAEIEAGPITYADAFEVQAYEHPVWRLHLRGSDLIAAMGGSARAARVRVARPAPRARVHRRGQRDRRGARRRSIAAPTARVVGTDLEALVAWLGR